MTLIYDADAEADEEMLMLMNFVFGPSVFVLLEAPASAFRILLWSSARYDDFTTTSSVSCEELNNEEEKFDQAQPQSELKNEVNNVELNNDQIELEQPVYHEKAQSDGNNDASVSLDLDDHEPSSVELNNDQEKSDQAQPAELLYEENTGGLKSDQMPTSRWGRRRSRRREFSGGRRDSFYYPP
ncbi:hypothetical protein LXL04_014348 [Taraxacum kok-saghyz]